jgi:hypothetical protein
MYRDIIFVLMCLHNKCLEFISIAFVTQKLISEKSTPDTHTKRTWLQAECIKPTFVLYRLPVPKIQYCYVTLTYCKFIISI